MRFPCECLWHNVRTTFQCVCPIICFPSFCFSLCFVFHSVAFPMYCVSIPLRSLSFDIIIFAFPSFCFSFTLLSYPLPFPSHCFSVHLLFLTFAFPHLYFSYHFAFCSVAFPSLWFSIPVMFLPVAFHFVVITTFRIIGRPFTLLSSIIAFFRPSYFSCICVFIYLLFLSFVLPSIFCFSHLPFRPFVSSFILCVS